jgi:cytochrome c biogenesis protein CcdA
MVSTLDSLSIQPAEMTLAVAIWVGVLASLNICAVVRLPVLAAYVAGAGTSRKHALILAGLFALGLAGGTWLLGLAAAPMADGVHKALQMNKYSFWILGFSLIAVGVLVSGLVDPQLVPEKWRRIGQRPAQANVPGALLLGFVLGLLQTPACPTCRAQLLAVVEAAPIQGSSLGGPILLVGFAVGQSLVALGVGIMVGLLKPSLFAWLRTRMCSLEQRVQLLTGNMLVVLGVYFVIVG